MVQTIYKMAEHYQKYTLEEQKMECIVADGDIRIF
jgi:hypothetical protein